MVLTTLYLLIFTVLIREYIAYKPPLITHHHHGGIHRYGVLIRENDVFLKFIIPPENIANDNGMMDEIKKAVEDDQCILVDSGIGTTFITLTINCPHLDNEEKSFIEERKTLPSLLHTTTLLASKSYRVVIREYITPITHPSSLPYHVPYDVFGGQQGIESYDDLLKGYFNQIVRGELYEKVKEVKSIPEGYKPKDIEVMAPWGLQRIDTHYPPLDGNYMYDNVGTGIDVYVLDTGIRVTHQEFGGRAFWLTNTVGDSINTDCNGHGTHVSSLVGGLRYGVAKNVTLWAVKVLDCTGNGDTFTIITGISAIVEHSASRPNNPAIASLSLGGDISTTLDNAITGELVGNGILTVVAAGNEYDDACNYSPGLLGGLSDETGVITVGASTQQDTKPSWSNYGSCVTISAPGSQVIGAWYTSDTATQILSGTSMATPFVSGVCALVLYQTPDFTPSQTKGVIIEWETPSIITGTSIQGGGKNLLYSLIIGGEDPPTLSPTSIVGDDSSSSSIIKPSLSLLFITISIVIVIGFSS